MYVTDTPVIDRLINPGPLDVVTEVERVMYDRITNRESRLQVPHELLARDHFDWVREHLAGPTLSRFDEAVKTYVSLAAADETDRHWASAREFSDELATRLAAIQ